MIFPDFDQFQDHLLIFDQVKRKIWAIAYADLRDVETLHVTSLQAAYQQASDRDLYNGDGVGNTVRVRFFDEN